MSAPAPLGSVPPSATPPPPLGGPQAEAAPGVTALGANRAALTMLLVQAVGAPLCVWAFGVNTVTALLLTFALNTALLLTVFRRDFEALRRDSRWRTPPQWGLALAAFVVAFLASRAWALAALAFFPGAAPADTAQVLGSAGAAPWLLVLTGGLLVPVIEEVAFRGLMLRGHERAAGFTVAALTTAAAFSLAHGAPLSVVGILPLAYALARLTQYSGSLWNAVIVHALNNTLALGLLVLVGDRLDTLQSNATGAGLGVSSALTPAVGAGALVFGAVLLAVLHLWLTPKPDGQERAARGPWLSGAYGAILAFGLFQAAMTFPTVAEMVRQGVRAFQGG